MVKLLGSTGVGGAGSAVSPPPPPPPPPVIYTALVNGTARNDALLIVGSRFTVGAAPITITRLGRMVLAGNSATHLLVLSDGATALGSVTVDTTTGTVGQVLYGTLGAPVVLAAGTQYYIGSKEAVGGDAWCNDDTTVTRSADVSAANAYYTPDPTGAGPWIAGTATADHAFGPPDAQYHL